MSYFDVIICGGGPAGSTCALALANSGLKVAVIDKAIFPRNKVCGDAVAAYVPKVLNSIHPKYAAALQTFTQKTTVNNCRIIAPNGTQVDLLSGESGFISTRMAFDNFLFKLASNEPNITWLSHYEITDVSINTQAGEATVVANNIAFKCKLVIGCDGAHSLIAKKLTAASVNLKHYSGAVRGYYKNVAGFTDKTYELHFIESILPGYFWIFPLPDNMANVGICVPSSVISKKKINLRKTMEEIIRHHPSISERFTNATLNGKIEGYGLPLDGGSRTISGDHFMICGDAASLIDPATGEGIGQSMASGRFAGWHALKCFDAQNFSAVFMKDYDRQLRNKLFWEARKSFFVQWYVFANKKLFNASFNLLRKNSFLRRIILKEVVKVAKVGVHQSISGNA